VETGLPSASTIQEASHRFLQTFRPLRMFMVLLHQRSATYGPRAGSDPSSKIIRPAASFQIAVVVITWSA